MLERLQRLFSEFAERGRGDDREDDPRVAAAALLAHVARADGTLLDAERRQLVESIAGKFSLGAGEAEEIVARGKQADSEAVDLYHFTSVLKAHLEIDQRIAFVNLIWDMIYVDGEVHELEDNLAWRIAELLGVSSRERMIGKREAAERSRMRHAGRE